MEGGRGDRADDGRTRVAPERGLEDARQFRVAVGDVPVWMRVYAYVGRKMSGCVDVCIWGCMCRLWVGL